MRRAATSIIDLQYENGGQAATHVIGNFSGRQIVFGRSVDLEDSHLDAERFAKVDPILDENAEQLDRELAALEFTDGGMTAVRIPGRTK